MKILFVLEFFYPYVGGSEKLFYLLTKKLASLGYQITVVTTRFDQKLPLREKLGNINIIRVPYNSRYLFTLLSIPKIYSLAKEHDFIHTTTYNAAFPAFIAGKLSATKVVLTFHEIWGKLWFKLPYLSLFERILFYSYEQIIIGLPFFKYIAVSNFTKQCLVDSGITESKINQIYNGIEYPDILKKEHDSSKPYNYIYYGRLGVSKGLNLLLEAVSILSQTETNFKLTLVIPKTPKGMYDRIIREIQVHGISEYINLKHELSQEELQTTLHQADCAVVPSYSEGFCFVAAEAVALGLPIISSHKGALSEVVSGKHLIMQEMNAKSLSTTMVKAKNNKWEYTPIKKFELERSVKEYQQFYDSLCVANY